MKKALLVTLLIFLTTLTVFAGIFDVFPKVKNSKKVNESTLVYVNFRDIRDLNPHLYGGEMYAQNLLFEGLIKIGDDGSYIPWLAESYKISDDKSTYIFELRKDVYFSDGTKFNAKAAEANFNTILDNYKRHTWLESIRLMKVVEKKGIKPVEATGEYELTIRLGKSYYPFLTELGVTRPFRFISTKAFINGTTKNGVKKLSGTGPYVLKENHIDEYAVFKSNENYWGVKPNIKKIKVKVISDNQARILALQGGEIDLIYGMNMISAETAENFKHMNGFKVLMSKPLSTRMLLLNTKNRILNDVRVRHAISHAINKSAISKGIFNGIEIPADTLFASNIPYANLNLKPYDFNREKTKKLLKEAGWKKTRESKIREKNGEKLELTLSYDSNEVTERLIGEFLQAELLKTGINLILKGEEKQSYQDRMKSGKFDIIFNYTWGTPYDPQSFLGAMRKPVHGDYVAQLGLSEKNKLDQTILKAMESTSQKERQKDYQYVLTILHNEAVYIPLTYARNIAIYNSKLSNVKFNASKYEVPLEKIIINN